MSDAQTSVLVIEHDPADDIRRLGDWLTEAGVRLDVIRPHTGQPLPEDLTGYRGLVVLGGKQNAYPDEAGTPSAPWLPACESLLRKAVRDQVPTLAICLGAQLLATAHGGTVAPATAGPELGPALVARRDAAAADPLFASVPFTPDVLQWHQDEVTELPIGAVLLAASLHYPHQAFRLGPVAWGIQFHIEPDTDMVAAWAQSSQDRLTALGRDPEQVVAAADALMDDLAEVWQPFAARFAAVVRGELAPSRQGLPLLGQ